MKKLIALIALIALFFTAGCTVREAESLIRAASSGDPSAALTQLAKDKAYSYATNPAALKSDIKRLENIAEAFGNLRKAVAKVWGDEEVKEPAPKEYVKYLNDYKSRALIDYEAGLVRVETIDDKSPKDSLRRAIITALLMPSDPRGEELFDSSDIKLGGEPYLYGEVLDHEGQPIRWEWRAQQFADHLIAKSLKTQSSSKGQIYYVEISMVTKHDTIRAHKYQDLVNRYATKYSLEPALVSAIIKTESDFNQYAISHSGAVGLMQIVPSTAGADAYQAIYGKSGQPTRDYLFDPQNNIQMGSAYLDILGSRYLSDVRDRTSKEYCIISSYNGGSGLVLRTFDSDKTRAFAKINALSPMELYKTLTTKVSAEETRNYLVKVVNNKKLY
jgi:membrane-bound lytic murein transglycosylase C